MTSGSADDFAAAAAAVKQACPLAMILVSDSPQAMAAAVSKTAQDVPLLASATAETADQMAKIAKDNNCPLVVKAGSLEKLVELSEKVKSLGVENIILAFDGLSVRDQLYNLTRTRVLSLKKVFRPLGYPTISFIRDGDAGKQAAVGTSPHLQVLRHSRG